MTLKNRNCKLKIYAIYPSFLTCQGFVRPSEVNVPRAEAVALSSAEISHRNDRVVLLVRDHVNNNERTVSTNTCSCVFYV